MVFIDRTLRCVECAEEFVFSADEQMFSRKSNFSTILSTARNAKPSV
jgi:hypothetical protein